MRGKKEQTSGSKGFSRFLAVFVALIMVLSSVNTAGPAKVVRAEDGGGQGTSLSIKASKVFDGGTLTAGQFTFQILDGDKLIATASNDAAGNIAFDEISFANAGTYTYTIKEVLPEGVNAENKIKDGIEYDTDARTLVVTVDDSLSITSVTLDGEAQTVETTGNASGAPSTQLGSNETVKKLPTIEGIGNWKDELGPLRIGDRIVYCFDDGVNNPLESGTAYTEFNQNQAPELQDASNVKIIKKLLYYGAPNDGGDNEIINWILEEGVNYSGYQYTLEEAQNEFEFITTDILHNITNDIQESVQYYEYDDGNGYYYDVNDTTSQQFKTIKIIDQVVKRDTGEFINKAKEREDSNSLTVFDMVVQKLWKKVIDTNTDSVADLVKLRIYTPEDSQHVERPTDIVNYRQRIITADITPTVSYSVTLNTTFANSVAEEGPEEVTVKISKVSATDAEKELPGAELVIKDAKGKEVEKWVSGEEIHEVQLAPGTYTLTEITAPAGYEKAETITFTVNEEGLVGGDKVTMVDEEIPEEPELPEEPVDDEPEEPGDEEPEEPDNEEPGEIPPVPGEEEEEVQPSSEGPSEEHSESTPESSEVENTSETPSEPVENESETPSQPEETTPEESTPEEPVDNESETPSQPEESGTEETEEPETVPPVEEETTAPVENESEAPTEPSQTAPTAPAVPGTTTPSLPDTGDHSNIGLYIGLLGFAAVGTGLLVATRRKKEEE